MNNANRVSTITEHVADSHTPENLEPSAQVCRPACPVCGGTLIEIRHKLLCSQCHTICETCCEGGRG